MKNQTANSLTKETLRILDMCGFEAWRQNNAAVYDPVRKVHRSNSATPGIPDILGFDRKTGRFICCEIKSGKDKLSIEQKRFIDRVAASGAYGFVIRSTDDITAILKQFGRKSPAIIAKRDNYLQSTIIEPCETYHSQQHLSNKPL